MKKHDLDHFRFFGSICSEPLFAEDDELSVCISELCGMTAAVVMDGCKNVGASASSILSRSIQQEHDFCWYEMFHCAPKRLDSLDDA